jgi:uncharacterized protein YcbX
MQQLGRLTAIYCYPVKSLQARPLESVRVEDGGLPGDRARALIVRQGHARVGKTYRGKENDRLHLTDDLGSAVALAEQRGVTVDVDASEPHFFDAAPVSLIVDRWLEGLNRQVGYAVEALRFRPNFVVAADPEFALDEIALAGATLHLGEARLVVRKGIERCVTPTYDLQNGVSDSRILRYVAQERGNLMGIYCDVQRPGRVRVGDVLTQAT